MKKYLLILVLVFINSYGQKPSNDIEITNNGVTSAVITVDGMSKENIYEKSKVAIIKFLNNPKIQILADEPGVYLKFKNSKVLELKGTLGSFPFNYECEIEYKDGKYKISFPFYELQGASIYNKKGEIKPYNTYKDAHQQGTEILNGIHILIKDAVTDKDDW